MTLLPLGAEQAGMMVGQQPFLWGSGGRRLTPEQIASQRQLADSLSAPDFSPVASPWQGLARAAGNVLGALQNKRLDKAASANAQESNAVLSALLGSPGGEVPPSGGNRGAVLAALANPNVDPSVKKFALDQYNASTKRAQPIEVNGKLIDPTTFQVLGDFSTPQQPHYWETNNGSLAMVGPDGKPQIVYQDPTPKITWLTADNGDGTKQIVPMGPSGPLQSQGAVPGVPSAPVGKLTPIPGGASPTGSRTFPLR